MRACACVGCVVSPPPRLPHKPTQIYISASFLLIWKERIKGMEFQDLILLLQKLPTADWDETQVGRKGGLGRLRAGGRAGVRGWGLSTACWRAGRACCCGSKPREAPLALLVPVPRRSAAVQLLRRRPRGLLLQVTGMNDMLPIGRGHPLSPPVARVRVQLEMVLSRAYVWRTSFNDAQSHLKG